MPINTPNLDKLTNDLRALLQFSENAEAARRKPAAPAIPEPIGRVNNALLELRGRRSMLGPTQREAVDKIGMFYNLTTTAVKNEDIYRIPDRERKRMPDRDRLTLKRSASYLLNSSALHTLHDEVEKIPYEAGMIGHSTSTMMVNAIANSVKFQTEHIKDAALAEARRGERICPMTLQPQLLRSYLREHDHLFERLILACDLPASARDRVAAPVLQKLAVAYFDASVGYPGAPTTRPDQIEVNVGSVDECTIEEDRRNQIKLTITLDNNNLAQFCNSPLPLMEDCENRKDVFRAHTLQGFGDHEPRKKMAAFYVQALLQKLSDTQENMGLGDLQNKLRDRSARIKAQQAASRTLSEMSYEGSEGFADGVAWENGQPSMRSVATRKMKQLWVLDNEFKSKYGSQLITSPRINDWIHSPSSAMDLMALEKPAVRLQIQVPSLTGQALLETPAFKDPD
ncbi:MAG: hypothetical protein V4695_01910 [Pseudomonadota bacterium]